MTSGPKVEAVTAGDPISSRAIVWARASRPSQMSVKWKAGAKSGTVRGQAATAASDLTARTEVTGLPAGELVEYAVHFEEGKAAGEPLTGSFRAVPGPGHDVSFLWSGDMVGQGWGIHPDRPIKLFDSMRRREANFFIHSGDSIYARPSSATGRSGRTPSPRPNPKSPKRSTNSAAAIVTTCSTKTSAASPPPPPRSGNGTTMR